MIMLWNLYTELSLTLIFFTLLENNLSGLFIEEIELMNDLVKT